MKTRENEANKYQEKDISEIKYYNQGHGRLRKLR